MPGVTGYGDRDVTEPCDRPAEMMVIAGLIRPELKVEVEVAAMRA
ncbi:hypothetical protein [Paracoccus salsus]|nr:hypothetical protein [Paracoccus salsus]